MADDPKRLDRLVEYLSTVIRRLMKHGHDREDAEDLAHDAYIETSKRLDTIADGGELGYLWMTAKNRGINQQTRTRTGEELDGETLRDKARSPEAEAIREQELARFHEQFRAAFAQLPPEMQQVLVLRKRGMSFKEVQKCLGLTPDTARTRASRGMDLLRKRLEVPHGLDWADIAEGFDDDHED